MVRPADKPQSPRHLARRQRTGGKLADGASPLNGQAPPPECRWKPGQSGNPRGRPVERPITQAIREALDAGDIASVKELAATGLRRARAGDFRFWREVLDRLDGPVRQELAADVTMRSADELIAEMDAAGDEPPPEAVD